jgi:hypothetical protein
MLLLYDSPEGVEAFRHMSPADIQQAIGQYRAWGDRLRKDGLLVDSYKLADDSGRVVRRGANGVRVTDGPFSETKEVLGGYYTVIADTYDQVVQQALSDCPHLEHGSVVIREVEF